MMSKLTHANVSIENGRKVYLAQSFMSYKVFVQVQIGGSSVKVLNRFVEKANGRFRGMVETVNLSIEIPRSVTSDPRGPEIFAKTLIELIKQHDPFKTPQTRAGVTFDSPEMIETVGVSVNELSKITVAEIVETMGRMNQSNKSPLELEVPRLSVRITYINPPIGSGKRKFDTGNILELTAFEKRGKMEVTSVEPEGIESNYVELKETRSNIMLNEGKSLILVLKIKMFFSSRRLLTPCPVSNAYV